MKFHDADSMGEYIEQMKRKYLSDEGKPMPYQPHSHMHAADWGSEPNPEKCLICYLSQPGPATPSHSGCHGICHGKACELSKSKGFRGVCGICGRMKSPEIRGKSACSEHQAQKFAGEPDEEEIRKASKPAQAASMGRDRKRPLRRDWEAVKERVMLDALRAKFTQHEDLKAILLGTGDAKLVEHTAKDSYWGDGGDGSGKNRLGFLLMKLREELQNAQPSANADG